MTTYANQRIVKIKKDQCKDNFLQINNDDWHDAIRQLSSSAFALYLYLASNNDGFILALSQKAVQAATGLSKASYHRGVAELFDNGYLTVNSSDECIFTTVSK
jgi:hypothetical protein